MPNPSLPESMRPSDLLGQVLGMLGRDANLEVRSVEEILRTITETAACTLGVPRVNIWLYDETRSKAHCIEGYDARTDRHESGEVLDASAHPAYFAALEVLRTVAVMDAEHDPRTEELRASYLIPHGISTMLDVPILQSGKVIGVICHEQSGPPRQWRETDRLFAGSVGDLVALVLETERRAELEREQVQLKERLARMERLDGMSWLAAGIAHDFRNLLMAVYAHGDVLARDVQSGLLAQSVSGILDASKRAVQLCDQLLVYSGRRPSSLEQIDLRALAAEVVHVIGARVPPRVALTTKFVEEVPLVTGDAVEIHRAIMNLVSNALDATRSPGGTVRVSVREDTPDLSRVADSYDFRTERGRLVLIEVMDDGVGMAPETLRRLFQPFFTTKEGGHGFGLPTVLGIVRGHGGALSVETAVGCGTTFRLWFPASKPDAPATDQTRVA